MLIKLLPDQIAKLWDIIRFGLVQTWELENSVQVQEVLKNLLSETVQCWFAREGDECLCLLLTRINICDITGKKRLEILTLYGFKVLDDSIWEAGFKDLFAFARSNGCSAVTATTENPRILQMAHRFRFKQSSFLTLEV